MDTRKLALAMLAAVVALSACFDSDDLNSAPVATRSPVDDPLAEGGRADDSGTENPRTAEPPATVSCRDAVACLEDCGLELYNSPLPEPDLTCFLECESGLNTEQALALLRLGACVSDGCVEDGSCSPPEDGTTGGDTGTGGTTTSETGAPDDACVNCIIAAMLDPEPPGCMALAGACE